MELWCLRNCLACIWLCCLRHFTLFACAYQPLSASHSVMFFSHNKSASARISQPEIIQRTGWFNGGDSMMVWHSCHETWKQQVGGNGRGLLTSSRLDDFLLKKFLLSFILSHFFPLYFLCGSLSTITSLTSTCCHPDQYITYFSNHTYSTSCTYFSLVRSCLINVKCI
jgi:hypothetical protein